MNGNVPIVLLASGRGSNFDAIHSAVSRGQLDAKILALVSDREHAPVLENAAKNGVKILQISPEKKATVEETRREHEKKILEAVLPLSPHFLVMAGYMRIVTEILLKPFWSKRGYYRVVNIHPSLLPAYPGVHAYERAFSHGEKETGVTVHLVDEKVDHGPICTQESFSIEDCKTAEEVEKKGLAIEHRLYPETLKWVLSENFVLENGGRCVRQN